MGRGGRDITPVELWKAGRRRKKLEGGLREDQVKEGWWLMGFRTKCLEIFTLVAMRTVGPRELGDRAHKWRLPRPDVELWVSCQGPCRRSGCGRVGRGLQQTQPPTPRSGRTIRTGACRTQMPSFWSTTSAAQTALTT